MTAISLISTHSVLAINHDGVYYECTVTSDFKTILSIEPEIENLTELEMIIREAAMNGEIENLNSDL